MIRLLVIADDLTGALDAGVQMAKRGVATMVALGEPAESMGGDGLQVLVADTESRHLAGEEAFCRVRGLVAWAQEQGVPCLYKKTDSTLRGNIGAELMAMLPLEVTSGVDGEAPCLVFAPAFPRLQRTTKNGIQYVDGVPLAETEFAADLIDPVRHSVVRDIIAGQCPLPVVGCAVDSYEKAAADSYREPTIVVADAETAEHMRELALALKNHDRTRYLAGCAGFAEVLPELLELEPGPAEAVPAPAAGGVLVVCGSVNSRSLEQVAGAARMGHSVFPLTPDQKLTEHYPDTAACAAFADEVRQAVKKTGAAVISAVADRSELTADSGGDHLRVAANMGRIARRVLEGAEIHTLVVFGGDTLLAIAHALGGTGIAPVKELFAGVVAARMRLPDGARLNLVTKAGGFGEPDILVKILAECLK